MTNSNKIYFNQVYVSKLFNDYAKNVFFESMRFLIKNNSLSKYESGVLSIVYKKARNIPEFFKNSYMIYL